MEKLLKKVKLGNKNLLVSRLCYGTLALGPYHSNLDIDTGADLLVYAYKKGINFWDTAQLYETYPYIKEALKRLNYPKDLVIASRSYCRDYKGMKNAINEVLNILELNKINIFGIHELGGEKDLKNSKGAIKALKEAKQVGLIDYIAITMHSTEAIELAIKEEFVDIVFPLYNKAGIGIKVGSVEDMTRLIKSAKEYGKGVYAMKVLAGGHLSSNVKENIEFVLNNGLVDSIAIGMDNINEINANVALFSNDIDQFIVNESKVNMNKRKLHIDPWCEGCMECIKTCPNNALVLEFSQAKVIHDKCVLCGYCASACKYFCIKVIKES